MPEWREKKLRGLFFLEFLMDLFGVNSIQQGARRVIVSGGDSLAPHSFRTRVSDGRSKVSKSCMDGHYFIFVHTKEKHNHNNQQKPYHKTQL